MDEYRLGTDEHIVRVAYSPTTRRVTYRRRALTWSFVDRLRLGSCGRVALTATVTATWADNQRRRRPSGGPVGLSEVGRGAVFGVVAEPEPDSVVDRDAVEIGRVDEPDVGGLVADGEAAADDSAVVGDVEFLTDFAVGVRDHVLRVGVDTEQACDLDVEAGLFLDLTDDALAEGFADVHGSAGQRPVAGVGPALQQHPRDRCMSIATRL